MKAIILAAGFGTRLRPITNSIPKCLVSIKEKPLIEYQVEKLIDAGINEFLINSHHLHNVLHNYVENSIYKKNIKLVFEDKLLGTAGTLIKNLDFFQKEDGLLMHGDNFFECDLKGFLKAHKNRPQECLMTMMLFKTDKPKECGIVQLDTKNIITHFYEKIQAPPSNLANGAMYILSKEMLKIVKKDFEAANDFSREILPKFMGKIYGFETNETYIDIGTLDAYSRIR
jgi:mannose-1-phosphate guanylyltransferase